MDAKDNGTSNPFADTLCSLEWIACAMEAARRHTERNRDAHDSTDSLEEHFSSGDCS